MSIQPKRESPPEAPKEVGPYYVHGRQIFKTFVLASPAVPADPAKGIKARPAKPAAFTDPVGSPYPTRFAAMIAAAKLSGVELKTSGPPVKEVA